MEKSNYSEEIAKSVFSVNARYTKLQNKTKVLYFNYLKENKSVEEFSKQVEKIWENIDHKFMDKQIIKLQKHIHKDNIEFAIDTNRINGVDYYKPKTEKWVINEEFFKLVPESEFNKLEKKFMYRVIKDYKNKLSFLKKKTKEYQDVYLENILNRYDERINQVIAYYKKDGGIQRYVQLSSYLSMLHNTDLTRSGWNQTLSDADYLGSETFIILYHPFSCPDCQLYQNKPLSKGYVITVLGLEAEEQIGDLLHPNCKCTLSILWDMSQIDKTTPNFMQEEENYKIRQKVNGITLNKNKLRVDLKIAKELGNEELVDKLKSRYYKLNQQEKELINKLPTETLKKQVKAINR